MASPVSLVPPVWNRLSYASIEKMCTVPVEEPAAMYSELGEKLIDVMVVGRLPLRKVYSLFPDGISNTRMTVPVVEAVARRVPDLKKIYLD